MCRLCGQTICPSACPESGDGVAPFVCFSGESEIFYGDIAYRFDDKILCEKCIDDAMFEVSV